MFGKLENLIELAAVEADKFYNKKNMAAGRRLRKIMQEVKALAQAIREDVSKIKNEEN